MRIRNPGGGRPGSRGAAIAELAVLLPILMLILLITIDYARLFAALTTISDCARDGALYYADHPLATPTAVTQAALADAADLPGLPPSVGSTVPAPGPGGMLYVGVTVTYDFHTLIPYPGIPGVTTLSRKVCMPVVP